MWTTIECALLLLATRCDTYLFLAHHQASVFIRRENIPSFSQPRVKHMTQWNMAGTPFYFLPHSSESKL